MTDRGHIYSRRLCRDGAIALIAFLSSVAFAGMRATSAYATDRAPTRGPAARADTEVTQPWNSGSTDNGLLASTRTDHGSLGQYCNVQKAACMWVIILNDDTCSEGGERPVLINTDREASLQTIRCVGMAVKRGAAFAFNEFDGIDTVVRRAERIAVAVPARDDKIVVYYFPLSGAVPVIDGMRAQLQEDLQGVEEGDMPPASSSGRMQEILFRPGR